MYTNCELDPFKFLTEAEAASCLRIKKETLRKWRRNGCGPHYIRCGDRLVRYQEADIHEWLSRKKHAGETDELISKPSK